MDEFTSESGASQCVFGGPANLSYLNNLVSTPKSDCVEAVQTLLFARYDRETPIKLDNMKIQGLLVKQNEPPLRKLKGAKNSYDQVKAAVEMYEQSHLLLNPTREAVSYLVGDFYRVGAFLSAFSKDEAAVADKPIDNKNYPAILLKLQRLPFIRRQEHTQPRLIDKAVGTFPELRQSSILLNPAVL
jgi:hypothetical protein